MDWEDLDFELEPDTHRYIYKGSEVPASTRILELARKPLDGIPRQALALATERGNSCHTAVELHIREDLDKDSLTREIGARLDSWKFFEDDYKVTPLQLYSADVPRMFAHKMKDGLLLEVPLVHPVFMYGVTPDLGLAIVNGALSTVEVKATSTNNDATALQLASQVKAIEHWFNVKVEERYGVRLVPNKRPDVMRYTDKADWATFLSFMNVSNWRKVHKIG